MVPYPLTRTNRLRLARAFAPAPRVDISIECALEDQMGAAFVDAPEAPQVFIIEQDQFFCYLAGDWASPAAGEFISRLPSNRFFMTGTPGWQAALQKCFGERLRPVSRHHYSSAALAADHLNRLADDNPHAADIRQVDTALASTESEYLSLGAFESPEDFVQRGIGFCLVREGVVVGAAYSSLVCSHAIEVSIVVAEAQRRQGVATALAARLLQWCGQRQIAPHWDAANPASCGLAEKLGYSQPQAYTAFYLQ